LPCTPGQHTCTQEVHTISHLPQSLWVTACCICHFRRCSSATAGYLLCRRSIAPSAAGITRTVYLHTTAPLPAVHHMYRYLYCGYCGSYIFHLYTYRYAAVFRSLPPSAVLATLFSCTLLLFTTALSAHSTLLLPFCCCCWDRLAPPHACLTGLLLPRMRLFAAASPFALRCLHTIICPACPTRFLYYTLQEGSPLPAHMPAPSFCLPHSCLCLSPPSAWDCTAGRTCPEDHSPCSSLCLWEDLQTPACYTHTPLPHTTPAHTLHTSHHTHYTHTTCPHLTHTHHL